MCSLFDKLVGFYLAIIVDCNNMCYMFKPSEIAKFSRIFDDSSLKKV
jgi:hypothetical protein